MTVSEGTIQADKVFLLGAGFSAPFGFPLASDLFSKVIESEKTHFLDSELDRILDIFFPSRFDLPNGLPPFEEFLSEIDAYLGIRPAWGPKPDPTIELLRGELLRALTHCLDALCVQTDFKGKARSIVAFAQRFQQGVTFITRQSGDSAPIC
ncbi:MAG: hypothetical protein V1798_00715 [Pseudomonadota bacterium]